MEIAMWLSKLVVVALDCLDVLVALEVMETMVDTVSDSSFFYSDALVIINCTF